MTQVLVVARVGAEVEAKVESRTRRKRALNCSHIQT